MTIPLAYYDLLETFSTPGCAICSLVLRDVDRFLDSLLYEYVNDPETHRAFRARRGLCSVHGWQLLRYNGGSLGTAILFEAVVDETLKVMAQMPLESDVQAVLPTLMRLWGGRSGGNGLALGLADNLEPAGECLACKLLLDSETHFIQVFIHQFAQLQAAYRASDGLCLPHFRQALRQIDNAEHVQSLVRIQRDIWQRLKADLSTFQAKSDHTRSRESMGAEADSWQRAVARMVGERGVFGPDRPATKPVQGS